VSDQQASTAGIIEQHITIVGAGLMGGSLALALRPHVRRLTLVDTDLATLAAAGATADVATSDLLTGVQHADLVVLATPVRTIMAVLAELPRLRPDGCLVLDLGSTKSDICAAMERLPREFQALGGHPMCGKEMSGFAAAATDLFQGAPFLLCRHGRSGPAVEAVVGEIVRRIGANPFFLSPQQHDDWIAAISHLPYLLAANLVRVLAAENDDRIWQVSGPGFQGASRLAGSDPQMMLDILLTNREAVLERLSAFQQGVSSIIQLLRARDEEALSRWLADAQRDYQGYRERRPGA